MCAEKGDFFSFRFREVCACAYTTVIYIHCMCVIFCVVLLCCCRNNVLLIIINSLKGTMNAPDRFLTWRWENVEDEQNRLTYQPDTKSANAATFILEKEDHTIGNLVRM